LGKFISDRVTRLGEFILILLIGRIYFRQGDQIGRKFGPVGACSCTLGSLLKITFWGLINSTVGFFASILTKNSLAILLATFSQTRLVTLLSGLDRSSNLR
jgi:hypothetical protein